MTVMLVDQGRVRTIALNRPERLNAFNIQLVSDLGAALRDAVAEPDVSVIVLTGTGRAFSAGADLKEIAEHMSAPSRAGAGTSNAFTELVDTLAELSKPLIIAVNGVGVGFGMTILGFADVAFMSSEAQLRCPFTAIGAPRRPPRRICFPCYWGARTQPGHFCRRSGSRPRKRARSDWSGKSVRPRSC